MFRLERHDWIHIIIESGFGCRTDRTQWWRTASLSYILNMDSFNVTNGQTFPLKFVVVLSCYYIADVLFYARTHTHNVQFHISSEITTVFYGRLAKLQLHVRSKNMDYYYYSRVYTNTMCICTHTLFQMRVGHSIITHMLLVVWLVQ